MTIKPMCSHNPDYTIYIHETLRQYYKKNQYWNVNINIELMKVCVKLYNSKEAPQLYAGWLIQFLMPQMDILWEILENIDFFVKHIFKKENVKK